MPVEQEYSVYRRRVRCARGRFSNDGHAAFGLQGTQLVRSTRVLGVFRHTIDYGKKADNRCYYGVANWRLVEEAVPQKSRLADSTSAQVSQFPTGAMIAAVDLGPRT